MKSILAAFFLLTLSLYSSAQPKATRLYSSKDPKYKYNIDTSYALIDAGRYKEAIPFLKEALNISSKSVLTRLKLVNCYYRSGMKKEAFAYLNTMCGDDWKDVYAQVEYDSEQDFILQPMVSDKRWANFKACLDKKREATYAKYNQNLRKELKEIRKLDQDGREEIGRINKRLHAAMHQLWEKQNRLDSLNLIKIEKIIAEKGYPGDSLVGSDLSDVAWLVIQHSDIKVQEKYFPLLKQAAENGQMSKADLALLIDRIEMHHNRPQVYGSQIVENNGKPEIYNLKDEEHVNERRASMGLGPLEDYVCMWGIKWEPKGK